MRGQPIFRRELPGFGFASLCGNTFATENMTTEIDRRQILRLERLSRLAGLLAAALALGALLAMGLGGESVRGYLEKNPPMAANTALCVIVLGTALFLLRRKDSFVRRLAGLFVLALGVAGIVEHIWPSERLWINHVFESLLEPGLTRHMSAPTGLAFALIGIALLLSARWFFAAQFLFICVLFLPMLALMGHIFHLSSLHLPFTGMALAEMPPPTAIAIVLLAFGNLARVPERGLLARWLAKSPSALVLRTFFLAACLVPIHLGVAAIIVARLPFAYAGYVHTLLTMAIIVTFLAATWFAVRALDRSEEALERTEARYRDLLGNAYDAIAVVNSAGFIEVANRKLGEWLGCDTDELIGRPAESFLPERFRAIYRLERERFAKGARVISGKGFDLTLLKRDGGEIPVEVTLSSISYGERRLVTAIFRDVTERKRAEDRQRFLSELTAVLSESMDFRDQVQKIADLMVPVIADFCVLYGYDEGKLAPLAWAHRDPALRDALRDTVDYFIVQGKASLPTETVAREGRALLMEEVPEYSEITGSSEGLQLLKRLGGKSYLGLPLIARGKLIGVLSLLYSDSGRRFSADDIPFAELIASRCAVSADNARLFTEAQDAIRAREEVLAVVSHDLKNPIACIDLSAQILGRQLKGPDPLLDQVRRIRHTGAQMLRLVQNLLNYGRMQSGKFTVSVARMRLKPLFEALDEIFCPLGEKSGMSLEFKGGDFDLDGDHDALVQALSNLVGNAIKFTGAGGRVEVSAEIGADERVRFFVRDTGQGMAPEVLQRIFERYWQPHETRRQGSGLGLYIAKSVVEAHKGSIRAESAIGKGSCFILEFPRWAESASKAAG